MKLKKIHIEHFKRFTDLTIEGLPETARLVVLVGPNGSGKTSLLEALNYWYLLKGFGTLENKSFLLKQEAGNLYEGSDWYSNFTKVKIESYGLEVNNTKTKGKFYFRSAYRNEPDFEVNQLSKQNNPIENCKLRRLIDNDKTVFENYQRLVSQTIGSLYNSENDQKTVAALRDELIGKIRCSLKNVFDDLTLSNIGDPLTEGNFFFEKGTSKNFHYKNLSAGEKSAFDLILDLIIKSTYFDDAVYCIDEPETHMHTHLQSSLLEEIYNLIPEKSQLWISTHSLGMLKKAKELSEKNPESVVFLDFEGQDFDSTVILKPTEINRTLWDRFLQLTIDNLPDYSFPERVVFCEGNPFGKKNESFDGMIYTKIFEKEYPGTSFISIGSCSEIQNKTNLIIKVIKALMGKTKIVRLIDRDDRSEREVKDLIREGVRVLPRRHIESYLFDEEIIQKLCQEYEQEEKLSECLTLIKESLARSVGRGNPSDDMKSASREIYTGLKRILGLHQCGNSAVTFMRDTLAPLITKETKIYKELEATIFNQN